MSPEIAQVLDKIGTERLLKLGSLVQRWENRLVPEQSFTDWVVNEEFLQTTTDLCNGTAHQVEDVQQKLTETQKELADTKEDVARLIKVNRDLYQKYEQVQPRPPVDIEKVRSILSKFNKENPRAVASGGEGGNGVTFDGHVKINSVESLSAFLRTMRARELGVPTNVLELFKVFVLDGRLVTLNDDYHGGVGYSYLWKKAKKTKTKTKTTRGAVGWASQQAKKYDPRLGIDPATGVNYIDPETGKTWVYPTVPTATTEAQPLGGKRGFGEVSDNPWLPSPSSSPPSGSAEPAEPAELAEPAEPAEPAAQVSSTLTAKKAKVV